MSQYFLMPEPGQTHSVEIRIFGHELDTIRRVCVCVYVFAWWQECHSVLQELEQLS